MNARQLSRLPDRLLAEPKTRGLRELLRDRGWSMSLLELDEERRRRGIAGPTGRPPRASGLGEPEEEPV